MSRRNKDAKIAELEAKLAAAEADAALDDANADARIAELEAKLSHTETEKLQIAVHDELMTKKLRDMGRDLDLANDDKQELANKLAEVEKRCGAHTEALGLAVKRIAELEAEIKRLKGGDIVERDTGE